MRIVQISDTHLCAAGGVARSNLERVASFVNDELRPDLIVHTGDLVAISPDWPEDRSAALRAHDAFRAPVRFLPGNHDVGEPGEQPWMGVSVTSERLRGHREIVGADRFLELAGDWAILGLNSQLFGSGLPEEDELWTWLDDALATADGRSVLLFMHMPLWTPWDGPSVAALSIPAASRERLLGHRGLTRLRAVGNGHLHRYQRRARPDVLEVWAPSITVVSEGSAEAPHFDHLGVVEWRLEGDTGEAWFRAPVDLEELPMLEIPELADSLRRLENEQAAPVVS